MRSESLPKPTTYRERKMCGAKHRFINKELAGREKQRILNRTGDRVNVYQCPYCHYWHVGRKRVKA